MNWNNLNLTVSEMMQMQKELFELHKDNWLPMDAKYGHHFILYMIEEIGECIAILKKKGDAKIVSDENVRSAFIEEMSDVLMYYMDTLLRFGVTPSELSAAYTRKHLKNMGRDFKSEYNKILSE